MGAREAPQFVETISGAMNMSQAWRAILRGPVAMVVVVMLVAGACSSSSPAETGDETERAQVMAAAMEELITRNNTFGDGPPPFTIYLLQANLDPAAGTATRDPKVTPRALTETERVAIEAVIEPFGQVQWIDDPAEWQTEDLQPTIDGAVILGVGGPIFDADGALVPVSLWCGGLCGTWLTYRLVETDDGWRVTGIEGPISIS